ncbi:MAG: glycosyltransferase family 4 protein [Acetobacter sp.]|nr:glycosyltransferase family 4 protein [Acetobacter sp.]
MRIAYIINSAGFGGAELPTPTICRVLQEAGHEVIVFVLCKGDGLSLPLWKKSKLNVFIRHGNRKDHLAALFWLFQHFQTWKPDLIWTSLVRSTLLGQIIGQKLNIPVVSWRNTVKPKLINHILLRLCHSASCLWIGDSQATTKYLTRKLHIPPEKVTYWPIFQATPSAPHAKPWQQGLPLHLGSLGRLSPEKGYDILIKAVSLLDEKTLSIPFHITIVGEGPERQNLQSLINQHNLQNHITLVGFLHNPHPFLSSLHLYLQPSQFEGFCIAAHEAMYAGLPVIASHVGELKYSVQNNKTGWSIQPNNPITLSNTIKNALLNPHTLAPMGQNARNYVSQTFSPEDFVKNGNIVLEKIYNLTDLK